MTSVIFPLLITVIFPLPQVWGVHPNILDPVSNATCQPEYAWMENAEGKDPCLTVAYVIAACTGDTWTQPALPSGYKYNSPNGTTATPCYCSWSCYNLMMACTLCQNPAYTSEITGWPTFSQNCSSNYDDQVFPQGYVIAGNISIPYWATINPTNWTAELFNIGQAQDYANQNHSDYYPSILSSNSGNSGSSNHAGAIAGGTVGGVVGLLLVVSGLYFLYRRMRRRQNANGTAPTLHGDTSTTTTHTPWSPGPSNVYSPVSTSLSPPVSHATFQPHGIGMGMNIHSPTPYSPFQLASPPPDTASFLTTSNTGARHNHALPMV